MDRSKSVAFWDRAARRSAQFGQFSGMLPGRKYEAMFRARAEEAHFERIHPLSATDKVLEVGSGGGRWALYFSPRVHGYCGVDTSREMVAASLGLAQRHRLSNVEFECTDLLQFKANSAFDLVYFSGVLQYMDDEDVRRCVGRCRELLTSRGRVISRDSVQARTRIVQEGDYPVIYRTEPEYRDLFASCGFTVAYSADSYVPRRFARTADRVLRLPGANYRLAHATQTALCAIDELLGRPAFLQPRVTDTQAEDPNPRHHRFVVYQRSI